LVYIFRKPKWDEIFLVQVVWALPFLM